MNEEHLLSSSHRLLECISMSMWQCIIELSPPLRMN